jgi:hypothetical protein
MSQPTRQLVFSVALCVVSSFASAQTTYKCGNSYSETPCVGGTAMRQDLRTDEQKREADETTTRQKKAAVRFEKDRIAQEKRDAKALKEAGTAVIVGKKTEPPARMLGGPKFVKPSKPAKPTKAAKKKKVIKPAGKKDGTPSKLNAVAPL